MSVRRLFLFAVLLVCLSMPERGWAQAGWQRFSPPDGSFALLLPGLPGPPKVENDGGVIISSWVLRTAYGGFVFSYGDYPSPPEAGAEITATLDNFLKTTNGTVGTQRRGTFTAVRGDALPALDFTYRLQNRGSGSGRIVVDGKRVYMWIILVNAGHDARADAARYLSSIAITAR